MAVVDCLTLSFAVVGFRVATAALEPAAMLADAIRRACRIGRCSAGWASALAADEVRVFGDCLPSTCAFGRLVVPIWLAIKAFCSLILPSRDTILSDKSLMSLYSSRTTDSSTFFDIIQFLIQLNTQEHIRL